MASLETVKDALKLFESIWPREMSDRARAERIKAYAVALADLSDSDVVAGAMLASQRERFFPPPAAIREACRPALSLTVAADAQAHDAYEGIVASYEGGLPIGPREVRERFGDAAVHAFCSAGGAAAFSWCEPGRDQAFRWKRFAEGYREACAESELARRTLSASEKAKGLSAGEASSALRLIEAKAKGEA